MKHPDGVEEEDDTEAKEPKGMDVEEDVENVPKHVTRQTQAPDHRQERRQLKTECLFLCEYKISAEYF